MSFLSKIVDYVADNFFSVFNEHKLFCSALVIISFCAGLFTCSFFYLNRMEGYREEDRRKAALINDYRYELSKYDNKSEHSILGDNLTWKNISHNEKVAPQQILVGGDYQIDISGNRNGETVEFYGGFNKEGLGQIRDRTEHLFILRLSKGTWIKPALKNTSEKTNLTVSLKLM